MAKRTKQQHKGRWAARKGRSRGAASPSSASSQPPAPRRATIAQILALPLPAAELPPEQQARREEFARSLWERTQELFPHDLAERLRRAEVERKIDTEELEQQVRWERAREAKSTRRRAGRPAAVSDEEWRAYLREEGQRSDPENAARLTARLGREVSTDAARNARRRAEPPRNAEK